MWIWPQLKIWIWPQLKVWIWPQLHDWTMSQHLTALFCELHMGSHGLERQDAVKI
jgi:hypothetical protein